MAHGCEIYDECVYDRDCPFFIDCGLIPLNEGSDE